MFKQLKMFLVNAMTTGTRPIRIFFFGGIFIALFTMMGLAKLFGIETDIGRDINLPNTVIIIVSLLFGFGISFCIIQFADSVKRNSENSNH